jgi:Xaa-Pro aminopeptidase
VWWPTEIVDGGTLLHEMRAIKSKGELDLMRRAIAITAEGHGAAMAAAHPGMHEFEVEAILRATFRKHGSERHAYEPIVGSGPNATVLHYHKNDRLMHDGDLLLIDAGAEYGYYASDVTRTFPVSGKYSAPQREIYEIVLEAQQASIDATRPGATLEQIHEASVRVIAAGLVRLGILSGSLDEVLEKQSYKPYYMHRTSHWLGMDVHDVGAYFLAGSARPLEAGMVITVEPGIYIAHDAEAVPEAYRGIGVRIEDDVLVTVEGCSVLSEAIPKSVEDVERACAG